MTKTIRGFKSKNGKKFDACLKLTKNEEGKSVISFDFDNVSAKVIKDVKCPLCGDEIIKTSFGYGCKGYDKNIENSCKFSIGKIAGVNLNENQLRELINQGITSPISGFKSKNGTKFEAKLSLRKNPEDNTFTTAFVFDRTPDEKTSLICPLCGGEIIKGYNGFRCSNYSKEEGEGCKFFIGKIAGVELTLKDLDDLINKGKTEKLTGFVSKKGTNFDACLKLDENKKIVFDFS